jgi:hypothetical protein
MKLITCLAHVDPGKLPLLAQVLAMQRLLCEEVHVCILTNKTRQEETDLIRAHIPEQSARFRVEVVNRD